MIEKYFYIDSQTARELLGQIKHIEAAKRGIDRHAFLLGDYVVLSTERLKLRNVVTRDDELVYLDEIIRTLNMLRECGIAVIPILGYCYDSSSRDGEGYLFQLRAKGAELYDDAIMTKFYVWAQNEPEEMYLSTHLNDNEVADYLTFRTHTISQVPQEHFDRFIYDMLQILNEDILIDCNGRSNFFYDSNVGFQYIDLDAHNDYKYGLISTKPDIKKIVSYCGFVPCHYAERTELFSHAALAEQAVCMLGGSRLHNLKIDNQIVFEKCMLALRHNGIPEYMINSALKKIKIFGR